MPLPIAVDAWKQLAEKADSARVEEVACALMDTIQRSQESMMDDVDRLRQLSESKAEALELVQVKHNMVRLDCIQYLRCGVLLSLMILLALPAQHIVSCRVHTARTKHAATSCE